MQAGSQNTPNHPEYVSGHATCSGAGAAVLAAIFGDRAFSTTSEDLPKVTRGYGSFSDAAFEAARSRVFAGIHYSFSGTDGLALGTAAAEFALRAFDRGSDTAPPVVRIVGVVSAAETVTVTIDQTAPTIALAGLASGGAIAQGQLLAEITDGTGSAIATLTYAVDGGTAKPPSFDPATRQFSTPLTLGEVMAGGIS